MSGGRVNCVDLDQAVFPSASGSLLDVNERDVLQCISLSGLRTRRIDKVLQMRTLSEEAHQTVLHGKTQLSRTRITSVTPSPSKSAKCSRESGVDVAPTFCHGPKLA